MGRKISKDWVCRRSGDCCRSTQTVQVSESELAVLRAHRPDVVPVVVGREKDRVEIAAGPCPYLDGSDCTVHAVRPYRCRIWGCFRRPGQAYADTNLRDRLVESAGVRRVWNLMLVGAEPWGKAHNWLNDTGDPR